MTIETAENAVKKTAEQIQSENAINMAIPNEAPQVEFNEAGEVVQPVAQIDAFQAVSGIVTIVPMGLHFAGLKNAAEAWNDEAINGISAALIPVLKKYSFGQRMLDYLQNGGGVAEGVLLMALYPVCTATYSGYLLDVKEREKQATTGKQEAGTPLNSTFEFEN